MAVAAFLAVAALAAAALAVTAFVATAPAVTAFIAATLAVTAFVAAFIAATLAATALVFYRMAASVFKDEAARAAGNRDRPAIATLEFVAGWAGRGRRGNAFPTEQFIASRAPRRWNDAAVTSLEHVAGWAFRTILMVARAPAAVFAVATARQSQRAAGAYHEKPDR